MKRIIDTKAAKSIKAYVIMKGDQFIAKVLAHFSDSGKCIVEVFGNGLDFHGSASGYGYDKFTAALSGCVIDGHKIVDHCGERLPLPECGYFARDFVAPPGYLLSNWRKDAPGYNNCYKLSGLDYLRAIGYQVIYVI